MKEDNRKEKIQVTIFDVSGKYRPISTIVKVVNAKKEIAENKKNIIQQGLINICHQRYSTIVDLKRNGYTQVKVRVYNPEEIAQQQLIKKLKNIKKTIDKEI